MSTPPTTNKHIVSRWKYGAIKALAVSLRGSLFAIGLGIAVLLANLPYSTYLDKKEDAAVIAAGGNPDYFLVCINREFSAYLACEILLLPLFIIACLCWIGMRKARTTLRDIEPITSANTSHLPASESLVRASQKPQIDQHAILLRTAPQWQETPQEQLLRASQPDGRE